MKPVLRYLSEILGIFFLLFLLILFWVGKKMWEFFEGEASWTRYIPEWVYDIFSIIFLSYVCLVAIMAWLLWSIASLSWKWPRAPES